MANFRDTDDEDSAEYASPKRASPKKVSSRRNSPKKSQLDTARAKLIYEYGDMQRKPNMRNPRKMSNDQTFQLKTHKKVI